VDATAISYVVLGNRGRKMGARLGDFVAVYSKRTHRSVFGIVGDSGNPSGNEGSLHLLQALGYPFHNGKNDAVEDADVVIRFYPGSNPEHRFFRTQAALDAAAQALGLSRDFSASYKDR
jgi:dihydrodipicolinate reductase